MSSDTTTESEEITRNSDTTVTEVNHDGKKVLSFTHVVQLGLWTEFTAV